MFARQDIYVEPEFRGKGLGGRLMKFCAEQALELGCQRLQCTMWLSRFACQGQWGSSVIHLFLDYLLTAWGPFSCVSFVGVVLDWNEPSRKVYKGMGAKELPEWILVRMDRESIVKYVERQK